ncbi:hypothetical protein HPP92_020983 [Vanilla planifolia]|uniref:Fe2OG dioxygenase domain-containing protein n=1 Tax=Vanilla planifolia TaxID=51239 RepID=A0A835PUL3_VANPL|nr:hypothetical protein HPP92_020983 [Vanilla planifolia]
MSDEVTIGGFGGSLRVDNVQALAGRVSSEIPERYVRPERKEEDAVDVNGHDVSEIYSIPIIDFSRLANPVSSKEETAKLHSACEDWGFFQLVNHGVPEEIINRMKQNTEEFFKLPLEEKEAFAQLPGQIEGYGQAFVQSEEQKLDWGDILFLGTLPPSVRQMRFWPTNPTSFRETIHEYAIELKKVSDLLLQKMSQNLGLEPEKLYDLFNDGIQAIRFNYYPPCPSPEKVLGLSPHSDAVGLTLLLQVNEQQGLQIRRKGGWLPVKALPQAFIVNIGDIVEILTNGRYKSIEHRAVVSNEKERLSVAGFLSLRIGRMVEPIPELVKEEGLLYRSITFEEYVADLFKRVQADSRRSQASEKHFFPPAPSASGRRLPRRPPPDPPPNQTWVRPTSQIRARVPPGLIDPHQSCDQRRPAGRTNPRPVMSATRADHADCTNPRHCD